VEVVGWWIGFTYDLGVVVLRWVCYLWSLWRLRVVSCGIMVGLIVCWGWSLAYLVNL
jgi:hypothetical protein